MLLLLDRIVFCSCCPDSGLLQTLTNEADRCCLAERSVAAVPARDYWVESPGTSAAERAGAAAAWRSGPLLLLPGEGVTITAVTWSSCPLLLLLSSKAACLGCTAEWPYW